MEHEALRNRGQNGAELLYLEDVLRKEKRHPALGAGCLGFFGRYLHGLQKGGYKKYLPLLQY